MLSIGNVLPLSISRANNFKKCPRSFYYKYVAELPEKQFYESALGSFFHYTLDHWACRFLKTFDLRGAMKLAYLDAKKQWEQEVKDKGNFVLLKDDLDRIKEWIKGYVVLLETNVPTILGHEHTFDFTIDSKYWIRGAIDRIDQVNNNTIRIVDYKAGSSRFIDYKQVCVYAKALINNPIYKNKKFIGTYIFVKENYKIVEYEITDELMNKTLDYLKEIGESIIYEKKWNPKVSPLCGWCSYKFQCAKDNNNKGILECL